jgi:hypothetical protein
MASGAATAIGADTITITSSSCYSMIAGCR